MDALALNVQSQWDTVGILKGAVSQTIHHNKQKVDEFLVTAHHCRAVIFHISGSFRKVTMQITVSHPFLKSMNF